MSTFDIKDLNGFTLLGLSKTNVILGKNGCGKSTLLKRVEDGLRNKRGLTGVRYLNPERGGMLQYEAGVDQNLDQNRNWLNETRRTNQMQSFRQQSFALFRRLELAVLRGIEREHRTPEYIPTTFDSTVDSLNTLLDRVRLERDPVRTFKLIDREAGTEVSPTELSSGEAELISLGIEFLAFAKECNEGEQNILLVDEPDVHLHPDLQYRFSRFVMKLLETENFNLVLATHSTAILAGLAEDPDTRVAFMQRGNSQLTFKPVSDVDRSILPIFGAHPLSNVFNQSPVLLIEGEDDERIWQQAVRSSGGKIRLFPCVVDGLDKFGSFEGEVNSIIASVYDDAKGFSLRDRDTGPEAINDLDHVVRMRLSCRAAENLMLSDDVLEAAGTDWAKFQRIITDWSKQNPGHKYHADVDAFVKAGLDRKGHDLKAIRNILVGMMTSKPWEVIVGHAIAALAKGGGLQGDDSLRAYLGEKACANLLKLPPA